MKRLARQLDITGQVQGVGFRPFVYRLARQLEMVGYVENNGTSVSILAQGDEDALAEFERRLRSEAPPLALIARVSRRDERVDDARTTFTIRVSRRGSAPDPQVTVDVAVCPRCAAEMRDPSDPRHDYPFINCTNCGPRYSIVRSVPYDRARTSMAEFAMCDLCAAQYHDPSDRRFHAQPVACGVCGPRLWLADPSGPERPQDDPVGRLAAMLLDGAIAAVKGLGGFHLACRADDDRVVRRLRLNKQRDAKPFAVMASDIEQARRLCELDEEAEALLTGPLCPITLAGMRPGASVAPSVAPAMATLGVMLPYTPLHLLIFDRLSRLTGGRPPALVMTSGNVTERPIEKDNHAAVETLGPIADVLLLHDREIVRRVEDSVVQCLPGGGHAVLRRGRGYAPGPIRLGMLGQTHPTILAVGAELKSAVCLLDRATAVLGEHLGDLKDAAAYRNFVSGIEHLEELFEMSPAVLVADAHPQYLSSAYALRRSRGGLINRPAVEFMRVQHHHAHAASCLAEHDRSGPVIALVCDGTGYGDDGQSWGCETLVADLAGYTRLGHLDYLPLLGGDAAAGQCWRPALAALAQRFGDACLDRLNPAPDGPHARHRETMAAVLPILSANAGPMTSSLGRWFDAMAWLCGLADENTYEAQAAMTLEAAAAPNESAAYPYELRGERPFRVDLRPMVAAVLDDLHAGVAAPVISARFHNTVIAMLADSARRAAELSGLATVVLSGGCFANLYLATGLKRRLVEQGFEVLTHRRVPCNDGGIALGQAVVAAWRLDNPRRGIYSKGVD